MNKTVKGADVPNVAKSRDDLKIKFSNEIMKEYIPLWNECEGPTILLPFVTYLFL